MPGLLPGCVPWASSGSGAVCGGWMGALSRAVLLQWEANLHASKLCGANGHYHAAPFLQGATRCWSAWCAGPCCTTSTSRAVCTASPSPLMAGMACVLRMGRFVEGWCWLVWTWRGHCGSLCQGLVWAGQTVTARSPGSCRAPRARPLPPPLQRWPGSQQVSWPPGSGAVKEPPTRKSQ